MAERLHLLALRLYARLPTRARRVVVRTIAPTYTVGAICVVEGDDDQILLVRQVYRSRWGIPGGLVQRGEESSAALRRERREEIGLEVEILGAPATVIDAEAQRVDVVYRVRAAAGSATVAPASPEIAEVAWFCRSDLPDLQPEAVQALAALAALGDDE